MFHIESKFKKLPTKEVYEIRHTNKPQETHLNNFFFNDLGSHLTDIVGSERDFEYAFSVWRQSPCSQSKYGCFRPRKKVFFIRIWVYRNA